MRNIILAILFVCPPCVLWGQSTPPIIPIPVQFSDQRATFELNAGTSILLADQSMAGQADYLAAQLAELTGIAVSARSAAAATGTIELALYASPIPALGDEGYDLAMREGSVRINANTQTGIFYGMQSFLQLIPAQHYRGRAAFIPCFDVRDYPRFAWRGLMLDVSRHFFPKEFVLRYLDEMSKHKLNVFHWHLTDDNGWRIEIKGFPELTDVGAWRVKRTGTWAALAPQPGEAATYGGFYTQADIREIVQYAKDRFITVVPEIDVPGHSLAMIASLPHLSCSKVPYMVGNGAGTGHEHNVLCVANDSVYTVLNEIFSQVAALFPDGVIHTGGDEVNYAFWENHEACSELMRTKGLSSFAGLQGDFEKRMQQLVRSKGKRMACWYGEYLEEAGVLDKETIVYAWTSHEEGARLSQAGHQVVMTPSWETYLDFAQGWFSSEPTNVIPGIVRLKHCYAFDVVPEGGDERFILGGQGNLWTESVPTDRHAEYMTWPRALALAEVFWSPQAQKDWYGFVQRVEHRMRYFDRKDINYAKSIYNPIILGVQDGQGQWRVKLESELPNAVVHYSFDGTTVDRHSARYAGEPLEIPVGASQLRATCFRNGEAVGDQVLFLLHEIGSQSLR